VGVARMHQQNDRMGIFSRADLVGHMRVG
jgi:hypothetical protein